MDLDDQSTRAELRALVTEFKDKAAWESVNTIVDRCRTEARQGKESYRCGVVTEELAYIIKDLQRQKLTVASECIRTPQGDTECFITISW